MHVSTCQQYLLNLLFVYTNWGNSVPTMLYDKWHVFFTNRDNISIFRLTECLKKTKVAIFA